MFNPMMYLSLMGGGGQQRQQQGGGGFLQNPMVQAAGLGFGGQLLGGLADMLGGPSEQEKRSKQMYNMGLSEMASDRDVINPMATAQRGYLASLPMINKHAAGIGRRMNLDSGQAQGALAETLYPGFMQTYNDASMENDRLKNQRRQGIFQSLMGQYGGY